MLRSSPTVETSPRRRSRGSDQRLAEPGPVDVELAAHLRMTVTRLARRLRQLDASVDGITLSQLSALYVLDKRGPMALGDLAGAEKVQPPTMTRIVTRLEELGLAARRPHATDGRVAMIDATAQGRTLVEESRLRRTAYLAEALANLAAPQRALLADAAELLDGLLQDER
jgi:DNA-binding MarR family transcriptional regulator